MMAEEPAIITLDRWETPATAYGVREHGRVRIKRTRYSRGIYHAYRTAPPGDAQRYDYFLVTRPIDVATLKIGARVWMVDDPPHWWRIQDHAAAYAGHVLCAGLGLGLIVHALHDNARVNAITVVERDPDVVVLVEPLLPRGKVRVVRDDWHRFVSANGALRPDGIFFDLFVGRGHDLMEQAAREWLTCRRAYPSAGETIHVMGFPTALVEALAQALEWEEGRR